MVQTHLCSVSWGSNILLLVQRKNISKQHYFFYQKTKFWIPPNWKHLQIWLLVMKFVFERKSYQQYLLFQQCFQKDFFPVNLFPHNDSFWRPWETSLLKTLWEKEKLLVTSNFSFTHSVFYQFRELSAIFIKFKIVICRLFQFAPV